MGVNMKKLLSILFIFILLSGCGNDEEKTITPTDEVKSFFEKYKTLDQEVVEQLNGVIDEQSMTPNQKEQYKNIFKRQYQYLKYNIKDEQLNGNIATVSVNIEVYDYYNVKKNADEHLAKNPEDFRNAEGTFDERLFWDYKLEKLQTTKSRRTYTLDLTLTKIEDKWRIDNLLDSELQKIHGLYQG
jgi:hypothetical protein